MHLSGCLFLSGKKYIYRGTHLAMAPPPWMEDSRLNVSLICLFKKILYAKYSGLQEPSGNSPSKHQRVQRLLVATLWSKLPKISSWNPFELVQDPEAPEIFLLKYRAACEKKLSTTQLGIILELLIVITSSSSLAQQGQQKTGQCNDCRLLYIL